MIQSILILSIIVLSVVMILSLLRCIKGPSLQDRLISVNVIGTKTVVLISIVSFVLKEEYFIDVVLVYALISFIATIVITGVMEEKVRGD